MQKRLIIVGAGGFGREISIWARSQHSGFGTFHVAGFLDDDPTSLDKYPHDEPILGGIREFVFREDDNVVVAIGDTKTREEISKYLSGRAIFATLVHSTAIVGSHCQIGEGSIICPLAVLTTNVTLGKHTIVNVGCCIGHDALVGSYVTLSPHVDISGGARLEDGVFVGSKAHIMPRAHVGTNAKVGAGSVVLRSVSPGSTVFGVPAKRI